MSDPRNIDDELEAEEPPAAPAFVLRDAPAARPSIIRRGGYGARRPKRQRPIDPENQRRTKPGETRNHNPRPPKPQRKPTRKQRAREEFVNLFGGELAGDD